MEQMVLVETLDHMDQKDIEDLTERTVLMENTAPMDLLVTEVQMEKLDTMEREDQEEIEVIQVKKAQLVTV